jgi:membrane protease YdiL (CAAX protease family)
MVAFIFLVLVAAGILILRATGIGLVETILYSVGLIVVLLVLTAVFANIVLPAIRGQKQIPIVRRVIDNLDMILAASGGALAIALTIYLYTVLGSFVYTTLGVIVFIACLAYLLSGRRSLASARARMVVFIFLASITGILIFGMAGISFARTVLYSGLLFIALVAFGVLWLSVLLPRIRAYKQPAQEEMVIEPVVQVGTGELAIPLRTLVAVQPGFFVASLAYLLAIAAAELVVALVNPLVGIVFHIVLLLGLVTHASLTSEHSSRKLYLALALAPLIRLLSLSMPLLKFPQIYWYAIVAAPLLLATFVVMRRLDYGRREVGLTSNRLPFQLLIGLTGIPFGIAESYILRPSPLINSLTLGGVLLPALILLVGTGFTEELVFRGVMQRSAGEALGRWGWIYVAVLFATLHIGYLLVSDVLFVLAVGLFFGWMVRKTGSLLGVSLSHGIANIVLYLIVPFFLV